MTVDKEVWSFIINLPAAAFFYGYWMEIHHPVTDTDNRLLMLN